MKKLLRIIFTLVLFSSVAVFADEISEEDANISKGWYFDGSDWKWANKDGSFATDQMKKSNGDTYYLNSEGNMACDFLLENEEDTYYFDENGIMSKNTWVTIDPSQMQDQPLDYDVYYMYFGKNGKAVKGKGDGTTKTIDGKTYIFDEHGIMLTGWINGNGEVLDTEDSDDWFSADAVYYAKEDGSLVEGWMEWAEGLKDTQIVNYNGDTEDAEILYFYFNPKSHKKVEGKREIINGKDYYFEKGTGRMYTDWQYMDSNYSKPKYMRLKYIESNGMNGEEGNYIKTGYEGNANTNIHMKGYDVNGTGMFFGGSHTFVSKGSFQVHALQNGSHDIPSCDTGGKDFDISITSDGGRNFLNVKVGATKVHTNYELVYDEFYLFGQPEIYIFGDNSSAVAAKLRLYSMEISEGDTLVRKFVPCRLLDDCENSLGGISHAGEIGLYDKVNNIFYKQEEGHPDLVPGPDDPDNLINLTLNRDLNRYTDTDGSAIKSHWAYRIPTAVISYDDYKDDVYEWFYTEKNGNLLLDKEKKINGKTYLFDKNGIMQTSLIIKYAPKKENIEDYSTNYYVMRVDLNETSGDDFVRKGLFYLKDEPIPYLDDVQAVLKESGGLLYCDSCVSKRFSDGRALFGVYYFGDDGVKKVGNNIKIEFSDGTYLFSSDANGGYVGFRDKKYYDNGFLCKANEDFGLGVAIDYNSITYTGTGDAGEADPGESGGGDDPGEGGGGETKPGEGGGGETKPGEGGGGETKPGEKETTQPPKKGPLLGETPKDKDKEKEGGDKDKGGTGKDDGGETNTNPLQAIADAERASAYRLKHIPSYFYNYNTKTLDILETDYSDYTEPVEIEGTMVSPYELRMPYLVTVSRGKILQRSNISGKNSPFVFVVDKSGKVKDKGKYKDKDGNYWLVDKNKSLVGVFEVDVKWGKVNGVETPFYKSTFYETNSKGDEVEVEKFMPFLTPDIYGRTEMNYVVSLDSNYLVNFESGSDDLGVLQEINPNAGKDDPEETSKKDDPGETTGKDDPGETTGKDDPGETKDETKKEEETGDPPKEDPPKEDPPKEDPPKEDPPKEDPPKEDPPKDK